MNNKWDMDDFGRDIKQTIQDAVNTGDFSRLSRNVNETVNRAFSSMAGSVPPDIKLSSDSGNTTYDRQNTTYKGNFENKNSGNQKSWSQGVSSGNFKNRKSNQMNYQQNQIKMFKFRPTKAKNRVALGAMIVGYFVALNILLEEIGFMISYFSTSGLQAMSYAIETLMSVLVFLGIGIAGTIVHRRCKRFNRYVEIIHNRDVCDIKELASATSKSEKYVLSDIEKMVSKGWFCQGHLDDSKNTLILSNDAYGQYRYVMANKAQQERVAATKKQAESKAKSAANDEKSGKEKKKDTLPPEVRTIVNQGEEYIRIIRKVNDDVPGEEVSNKMYRMEELVRKIFKRIEEKPEQASDLKKLMDYYLPTSIKLLEAYADMDKMEVQGENIINSKKEIEDTLDTLNVAYEKFLDDMFKEDAWDISSDVSVLKSMLAQEGLTENGFEK